MFVQHGMVVDVAVAVIRCYHPYSFQIYLGKTQHPEKSRRDTHEPVLNQGTLASMASREEKFLEQDSSGSTYMFLLSVEVLESVNRHVD